MDVAQPVTDTLIISDPKTWVDFAFYVFDKFWPLVAAAVPGFLAGWLGVNKPAWMQKKAPPTP
jgi:hypothetical protein